MISGIATYYQAVLPYELGLITEDRFIVQLNNILSSYYTSPAIHMSSVECSEKAWSDNNAQRLPYYRGVLYLLHIDAEIRKQTEGKKSLRDSSIKLIQLRLAGLPYTFEEWLNIIGADIDRDYALRLFMDMSAGNWVVPPPTGLFGDGIVPVRQDQYVFEDGFVRQTQGNQTVFTNVTRGSRADLAGLKIGDRMTWSKYRNGALDDYSRNVSYTVTCEVGDEREIAYWPRGFKEVENWQYGRKARSV
jgi:predicted metalloprotease with PDZ domain